MEKTILFSPVKQDPNTLSLFLKSISNIKCNNYYEIWLYDDNENLKSKELLSLFSENNKNILIINNQFDYDVPYMKDKNTHLWNVELIEKITKIKNFIIKKFLFTDFNEIFLIDSDLLLHPNTLMHLQSLKAPIVSEVFWTKFFKNDFYKPNVWDFHIYEFFSAESIIKLKKPGVYKVGGLGACTLVQREPLEKNVHFSKIEGLELWGEDRYFCTRASCHGFDLLADTHFPPFHIYRSQQLKYAETWYTNGCSRDFFDSWLDSKWENRVNKEFKSLFRKLIPRTLRKLARILEKY